MEPKTSKQLSAPYISPITFMNSVDLLKPMPPTIDKTVFGTQAGGIQAKIIATFQFLKLIDDKGVPQPLLRELANSPKEGRGEIIRKMLMDAYPFMTDTAFDLSATSTQGLEERFRPLNVSGSTTRKAMAFFASLARDAGIEVSPHVKATRAGSPGGSTPARRRTRRKDNSGNGGGGTPPVNPTPPSDGQDFWLKALERLPVFAAENMDEEATDRYVRVLETIVNAKATQEATGKSSKAPRRTLSEKVKPEEAATPEEDQE